MKQIIISSFVTQWSYDWQFEDLSDETIALRHERSEREEYKRRTYTPNQTRIRHNRRIDSRADSGANTPGMLPRVYHEFLSCHYYELMFIISIILSFFFKIFV